MRRNGILLHISSLPSPYGIGKLGKSAHAFVDFLVDSRVQVWQVLPTTPTGYGNSPYQSFSVFAGNPYFIDFEQLEEAGLLQPTDYKDINWGENPRRVDYARVDNYCNSVLHAAFDRFEETIAYQTFVDKNKFWLDDYALFMALKDAHQGKPWYEWEKPLATRQPEALIEARETYKTNIKFYCAVQFWFYQQWKELHNYCRQRRISIIGDMPIYAAYDSVDVWSSPDLFLLNQDLEPRGVAGCPPDAFSPTGQLWGNPLYDWDRHQKTGFSWWIKRLSHATTMYDTVRIDHFRGFESYYAIPYGNKTAEIGIWQPGPGMALFEAVKKALGDISVIAEDLGFMTPQVKNLLEKTGFPGMKVMQFAFDGDPKNEHLPQNFTSPHCVAYTGTHDNTTLRGWAQGTSKKDLSYARQYLHCRTSGEIPTEVLCLAWSSIAELAIAQIQDFLDLGDEGRMNTPSTIGPNWQFRMVSTDYSPRLVKRIRRMNERYNRIPYTVSKERLKAPRENRRRRDRHRDISTLSEETLQEMRLRRSKRPAATRREAAERRNEENEYNEYKRKH